jgi:type I restriction enzyme S subunit
MTGALPSGWRRGNIRRFAAMKTGHTPSRSVPEYWEDTTIPWFTLADVWQLRDGQQVYLGETANRISELGLANSSAELLPAGTVVLSRTASVGFSGVMPVPMATSQDFWNWVSGPDLLPEYLNYQFKSIAPELRSLNMGSTHQTIYQKDAAGIEILVPPLETQRAVAEYLDRETAQIDTLIAEQERLIELLRERRGAVVDNVIAAGLRRDVEMNDSGVSWIGRVPAHWRVRPLWSMYRRVKDVDHPEEQMLSVFRDYGVVAKDSRDNINQTAENRSIYQLVHPGWLVSNRMKAWQGSVGISSLRGIVSGHYICFEPSHSQDHGYLNWLFRSARYAAGYRLISRGVRIGQAEIDNDSYRVLPVLVPPLDEQREISAYLSEQTLKIDSLISEAEWFIELAQERRSVLITAAVTGQIDVRGEVA